MTKIVKKKDLSKKKEQPFIAVSQNLQKNIQTLQATLVKQDPISSFFSRAMQNYLDQLFQKNISRWLFLKEFRNLLPNIEVNVIIKCNRKSFWHFTKCNSFPVKCCGAEDDRLMILQHVKKIFPKKELTSRRTMSRGHPLLQSTS